MMNLKIAFLSVALLATMGMNASSATPGTPRSHSEISIHDQKARTAEWKLNHRPPRRHVIAPVPPVFPLSDLKFRKG